jgi:hypothetical protein
MLSLPLDLGLGRLRQAEAWLQRVGRAPTPTQAAPAVIRTTGRRWTVVVPRKLTERRLGLDPLPETPPAPEPFFNLSQLTILSLAASVLSGMYVYAEKHEAARLDAELAGVLQRTQDAQKQAALLRAEWALANDPDRLRQMAARYLTLQPIDPAQFTRPEDLAAKLPPAASSPANPFQPSEAQPSEAQPNESKPNDTLADTSDTTSMDIRPPGTPQALAPVVVAAPTTPVRVIARAARPSAPDVTPPPAPQTLARAEPQAEPRKKPPTQSVELDPGLVKSLLQGHGAPTRIVASTPAPAPPKPHLSYAMAVHHGPYWQGVVTRSDPPHELTLPPEMAPTPAPVPPPARAPVQTYAQAEPARPAPAPRNGYAGPSAIGGQRPLPPPTPYYGYYAPDAYSPAQ